MAVMLIESTDPNFSHYLKKNPANGLTIKSVRSGVLSGWYPNGDAQKFALWFRETGLENSFSTEDGKNYLDLSQFASTYFVFNAISQFFNSTLKMDPEQPYSGVVHKITIPNVQLRTEKTFNHLAMMIEPGYFTITKKTSVKTDAIYSIEIHSDGTFNEFMMRVYLLFYLLHADHYANDIVYMEGMIGKVITMMQELRVSYFVWYWFKKNVLIKRKFFDNYLQELGKNSCDGDIVMEHGDTQKQRKAFVDQIINTFKSCNILDVGCGEGYYLLPYAKTLKEGSHQIVGVDPDTEITKKLQEKLYERNLNKKTLGLPNACVVSSLDKVTMPTGEGHAILCIEVIEHMPKDEAKELVVNLLKRSPAYIVLTTPNIDFNVYYGTMTTKFRHDDHHFEFTLDEFKSFIAECIAEVPDAGYTVDIREVGDKVNGSPVTWGSLIYKEGI